MWGGCDDWGCGSNSGEVDHLGLHDIHGKVGGRPNANGFRVTKIQKTSCAVFCTTKFYDRVFAVGGELRATGASGTLTGAGIAGLEIFVSNGANKYIISVASKGRNVNMWAHITGFESWPQYVLEWDVERLPGQKMEWKAVCTHPPTDGSPDLLGMNAFHSVVFENDEIDATRKIVVGLRPEPNWIDIGCAGHAVAKMLLTGNTSAGDAAFGFHSTFNDKTAALKMITGDVCGTGHVFTVAGQPLQWIDAASFNKYMPGFAGKKEALWTHKGATCLNKPRVLANPTALGTLTFPTLETDIKIDCGGTRPPFCADLDPYSFAGHYYISSNP